MSLDAIQTYASQPILPAQQSDIPPSSFSPVFDINYAQLFCILFVLVVLFRSYRLVLSTAHLRLILGKAIPYKKSGRLVIAISQNCHIPFSVYFLNKAYIVLPISLLSSAKHIKIAIAHEGQHHRNRDCV